MVASRGRIATDVTHVYGVPIDVTFCPGKRVSYSDGCQVFRRNSDVTEVREFFPKYQEFFPSVRTLPELSYTRSRNFPPTARLCYVGDVKFVDLCWIAILLISCSLMEGEILARQGFIKNRQGFRRTTRFT